jgi:tetratricopeptide (TPR) repeat protein
MSGIFERVFREFRKKQREGERLFRAGLESAAGSDHEQAINLYSESISVSDAYPAVFLNRGASYQVQERYLDAWDDYQRIIAMESNDPSPNAEENIAAAKQNMRAISIFINFDKDTGDAIRSALESDGFEHFTRRFAEELGESLQSDSSLIKQFISEELKEMYDLGGKYRNAAESIEFNKSSISYDKNNNETQRAFVLFKSVLCCFSRDQQTMLKIRTAILSKLQNLLSDNSNNETSLDRIKETITTSLWNLMCPFS